MRARGKWVRGERASRPMAGRGVARPRRALAVAAVAGGLLAASCTATQQDVALNGAAPASEATRPSSPIVAAAPVQPTLPEPTLVPRPSPTAPPPSFDHTLSPAPPPDDVPTFSPLTPLTAEGALSMFVERAPLPAEQRLMARTLRVAMMVEHDPAGYWLVHAGTLGEWRVWDKTWDVEPHDGVAELWELQYRLDLR